MKFRETQVIVFANQKGGCGKTSSLVSTAAAFAASGYSVCVVDTDSQCDSTGNLGVDPDAMIRQRRYTLADAYLSKIPAIQIAVTPEYRFSGLISVVPGHRALSSVEIRLERGIYVLLSAGNRSEQDMEAQRHEHRFRLRASLDSLRGRFDVVLIDTPPNLGFLMTSALIAADWCVIPTFPSGYDLKALQVITRTVEKIRKTYNPSLGLAGVLLGNYDRTARLDQEIHAALCKRFTPALVFATTIGRSVRFRETTERGITIFEHPEGKEQAANWAALVKEMINRGTKGTRGATLNPFPGTELVEQVVGSDSEDVEAVNG